MSKKANEQIADYLEQKKEAGLLPEYYWKNTRRGEPVCSPNHETCQTQPGQTYVSAPTVSTLENIRTEIGNCTRCRLSQGRKNIVFGVGNPKAELMFVGEAPGRDEDIKGEPFVGRAGQLLTKIIEAMGFKRSDVYIANVVKCRPPENRNPAPDEIATCSPFLFKQIELIHPKVIVGLGTFAVQTLLGSDQKISQRFFIWKFSGRYYFWKKICRRFVSLSSLGCGNSTARSCPK